MNNEYVRKWWRKQVEEGYFTGFSFGFSYKDMSRFNLENKKIMEIGYGYGRELSQFCKISNKVFGVDIAPAAMPLAYQKLKEQGIKTIPLLKSYDGLNPPFDDKDFDFIYSCFVIQHMSKANAKELIGNCLEHLKKDGRILFEFFGDPSFMGGLGKDAFSGTKETGMYNNAFTKEEIFDLIKDLPCSIDWIDEWKIDDGTQKFNNYWVCIKRQND